MDTLKQDLILQTVKSIEYYPQESVSVGEINLKVFKFISNKRLNPEMN